MNADLIQEEEAIIPNIEEEIEIEENESNNNGQIQAQYKSIFNEEALAELHKRFKQDQEGGERGKNDMQNAGGTGKEKEGDLKFYGDEMTFEYRMQMDLAS